MKVLVGPRTWSSEPLGDLGAASAGQWSFHLIQNQTSRGPAVAHHAQATQPATTDTAHHEGHSQGNRRAKVPGHSLQRSAMTKQKRIHVRDSNNQVKESRRVYRVFHVCDVI